MCLPHRIFTLSEVLSKYPVFIVTPFLTTENRTLEFKAKALRARSGTKVLEQRYRLSGERGREINDVEKGRREKKKNKKINKEEEKRGKEVGKEEEEKEEAIEEEEKEEKKGK